METQEYPRPPRKLKDYKLPVAVLLLLGVAVGYRTWQDMTVGPQQELHKLAVSRMPVYLQSDADIATLPHDGTPAIIETGIYTGEGFTAGIAPVTLPQRESTLLVRTATLDNPEGLSAALTQALESWQRKNNIISEVALDYRGPDIADISPLTTLVSAWRDDVRMRYWTGLRLQRDWLEDKPENRRALLDARKHIRTVYYNLSQSRREGETLAETLAALEGFGQTFILLADDGTTTADIQAAGAGLQLMAGIARP